ncbi:MAG TPA: tetratricopeptide repeat protein [Opitutaceae bacterium]|nr:tetratricopeptide repeat protein [Opitutaceae bacterium]
MAPRTPRETAGRVLLAAGCLLLLVYFFSPSWGAFRLWARVPELSDMMEVRRGAAVLEQVAHPGTPVADELHRAIQWRLLFPLIGHVLHLSPPLFFALADLGAILVLGYLVALLRNNGFSWTATGLAAVTLGAASWFFTSTGWLGYFDSWLALALLLLAFAESRWILWCACLLAPWVDERFVLAAPFALLCRWLWRGGLDWRREAGVPAALLALFVAVRLGFLAGRSAAGATVGGYLAGHDYLDAPPARLALGVWEGLRFGWLGVGAGVVLLWPQRGRALGLALAAATLAAVGLATAQDYSRSMTMLLPAALLGLLLLHRAHSHRETVLLAAGAALALLLPAHHVMNDRVNPIYHLQHELAVLETPPPIAMPELYELRAIHEMERGEFPQADADLDLAIRLAANPASPARQRGILAASQGRWDEALRYFSLMAENDPQNPDAWFMCAQASLALGRPSDAHAHLDHARSLAPADWTSRPDVARFLAKLGR